MTKDFRKAGVIYIDPPPANVSMENIQNFAEEVGKVFDIQNASQVTELISDFGGVIHFLGWEQLVDGTIYVHGKGDFDICLSTTHSPTIRDRFTIAHEFGHYVLHSRLGERPIMAARNASGRTEWEANWFAAALLMPSERFRKAWAPDRIGDVASYFGVSYSAAKVRAKALGLLTED
jgi:predicted transcriptional regulator